MARKPELDLSATKEKPVKGSKNGEKRLVPVSKAPKYYPAEDVKTPKVSRKSKATAIPTLKKNITPGTVLILLAGKYKGKRVVFLKQLPKTGLLLVTGPYKINGVPLRRVNQAYTIATSTKIDISSLTIAEKFDDSYFSTASKSASKGTEAEFFKDGEKAELSEADKEKKAARAADQKSVDKALIEVIGKTPNLAKYLGASFALSKGQYPHLMKF